MYIYVHYALLFYVIMSASSCDWMAHSHNYYTDIYEDEKQIYMCSNVRKFERFLLVGVGCDVWSSVCVYKCIYVHYALLFYVIMSASSCDWMANSHNYYTDIYEDEKHSWIFTYDSMRACM